MLYKPATRPTAEISPPRERIEEKFLKTVMLGIVSSAVERAAQASSSRHKVQQASVKNLTDQAPVWSAASGAQVTSNPATIVARVWPEIGARIRHVKAAPPWWLRPPSFGHTTAKLDPVAFRARCPAVRLPPP